MSSRQTSDSEAALVSLFMGKRSCNITFVLDSSETTTAALGSVKRLLIQTLLTKAAFRDSLFNIITFSDKVKCWSDHMLPCAPDTVYTALSWIHAISCSPGRDLLAALSLAITDPSCHIVHLLLTDLPDQPEAVLRALPALATGRPVNVFYLLNTTVQPGANFTDYLRCLSQTTRGSCYVITESLDGKLGKVIPLLTSSSVTCCCPSSSVIIPRHLNASSPLLRCSLGNPLSPFTSCVSVPPPFFPGCRVLARREVDGLYHLGTVTQEVQGRRGLWVVDFDHPAGFIRQLVCSLDMMNHDIRDRSRYLVPGDAVLSPWEPDLRRYGPGRVMTATRGYGVDGASCLRVLMWNGCVSLVPHNLVSHISASQYDRLVRELQIQNQSCVRCSTSSTCCRSSFTSPTRGFRSSSGPTGGLEGAEKDQQVEVKEKEEVHSSSSSSSSPSDDEIRSFPLSLKLRSKQRPPWRYWRRTGPEPQHRQPGSAAPRRISQPLRFSFPVPPSSSSPNHSSLFQSLPVAEGRRTNVRDVIKSTDVKPRIMSA